MKTLLDKLNPLDLFSRRYFVSASTAESQLEHYVLLLLAICSALGALFMSGYLLGELGPTTPSLICALYFLVVSFSVALAFLTGSVRTVKFAQLNLGLWLPFILQWSLGGIVPSGAMMIWALLVPIGATIYASNRASALLFAEFTAMVILTVLSESYLRELGYMSEGEWQGGISLVIGNTVGVTTVIFLTLTLYLRSANLNQKRSDVVLNTAFPKSVASRLLNNRNVADKHDQVGILFVDIVDFTRLAQQVDADDLIEFLSAAFTHIDKLVRRYGLEKVKTIGDAYMVAAGISDAAVNSRGGGAVFRMAEFALKLREEMTQIKDPLGNEVHVRIGMHCGPVIAGVIGGERALFDIWGDTVNIASRMETTGSADKIQVSAALQAILCNKFNFKYRDQIEIKGIGLSETYFLTEDKKSANKKISNQEVRVFRVLKQPLRRVKSMLLRKIAAVSLALLGWMLPNASYSDPEEEMLTFSVVPQFDARQLLSTWQPIVELIASKTGENLKLVLAPNIENFEDRFEQGEFDFAFMNPYHVLMANAAQGYTPILRNPVLELSGVLVVRKDSGFESPESLKGHTVAFPSPNAFGASLLMRAEFKRNFNINVSEKYVGSHDSVYLNVVAGLTDAGGGIQSTFDIQSEAIKQQLTIIHKTLEAPSHAIAAHPRVAESVVLAVRQAFVEIAMSEESSHLLKSVALLPIAKTELSEYLPLQQLDLQSFVMP